MPFYQENQSAAIPIAVISLLQGLAYWLLKLKFKPYVLLLRESKPTRSGFSKYRANCCVSINKFGAVPYRHLLKLKESGDFDDELCCLCNERKAKVVFD